MSFKAGSYPGVVRDIADSTHFNNFGAYELAQFVTHGIRADKLPIAKFLDPAVPRLRPRPPGCLRRLPPAVHPTAEKEDVTEIPQANLK